MKLTPKQQKFAELYVQLGNGSEAYRQAYDVGVDTKNDSIKVNASKLLADTNISLTVKNLQAELKLKHEVTRSRMVEECFDIINLHKGLRDAFKGDKIKAEDMKKVYALANSGFINGGNVMTAITTINRLMGLDKEDKKQEQAQTINNIQINIKREHD